MLIEKVQTKYSTKNGVLNKYKHKRKHVCTWMEVMLFSMSESLSCGYHNTTITSEKTAILSI